MAIFNMMSSPRIRFLNLKRSPNRLSSPDNFLSQQTNESKIHQCQAYFVVLAAQKHVSSMLATQLETLRLQDFQPKQKREAVDKRITCIRTKARYIKEVLKLLTFFNTFAA